MHWNMKKAMKQENTSHNMNTMPPALQNPNVYVCWSVNMNVCVSSYCISMIINGFHLCCVWIDLVGCEDFIFIFILQFLSVCVWLWMWIYISFVCWKSKLYCTFEEIILFGHPHKYNTNNNRHTAMHFVRLIISSIFPFLIFIFAACNEGSTVFTGLVNQLFYLCFYLLQSEWSNKSRWISSAFLHAVVGVRC